MFILLRRIERWLHQQVFKAGWLITHDYQTTTILYYTFFLPGVFIHELLYWLVAGALGVHAGRSLKWPEQQEIGELKLNFVQISNKAGVYRKAIISAAPMIFGLVFIWYIAANVFDIMTVVGTMSSGKLGDVAKGVELLLAAPLFWLWSYIIFTVANTMYPTIPKDLQGWRTIALGIAVVILVIVLLGIGGTVFETLQTPLSGLIAVLQTILVLIIGIDILMVLALGTIEYTIERMTGHSATIQGGKLVTVTRQEALEEREKERERERRRAERRRNRAIATGPGSVYLLDFSIPGAPGEEPITKIVTETAETPVEEKDEEKIEAPTSMPLFGGLAERTSIESAKPKPLSEADKERHESIASRIKTPERRPPVPKPEEKTLEKPVTAKPVQPSLIADDADDEKQEGQPITPAASRFGSSFGRPKPVEADADSEETAKPSEPSLISDDAEDKPIVPAASRFGSSFGRPKPVEADVDSKDEVVERPSVVVGRPATGSRFKQLDEENDETDEDEELVAKRPEDLIPRTTRFGISKPASDEDKEDESSAKRLGTSPFSRPLADESKRPAASIGASRSGVRKPADEDDEELDSSILRQGRGKDAIASLFGGLNEDTDDEEDENLGSALSSFRRPTLRANTGFGSSKPAPKSTFGADEDDEEDESLSSALSSFRRPPLGASTTRFGTSRPAPKPISDDRDDEDEDKADEDLIYEDIEDAYIDDDDDEYVDYDD